MEDKEFKNLLEKAMEGDSKALEEIFIMYDPIITKYSRENGIIDNECKEYIKSEISLKIKKFKNL